LAGYQYCDLLLALGRVPVSEVRRRAEKALEISMRNNWLLLIALDCLTLARVLMLEAGNQAQAGQDLKEVLEIAQAGDMKLHLTDYHLEYARLCDAMGKMADAGEHYGRAEELVEETGYKRRLGEIPGRGREGKKL